MGAFEHRFAHVVWWVLHITGLAALCILPSDLRVGEAVKAHHWLVAVALSINVLAHYAVRFSDPGWASPPSPADSAQAAASRAAAPTFLPSSPSVPTYVTDCESAAPLATTAALDGNNPVLCPLCGCLRRAPATTHCRYCNRCVEGFDHHCMWLGVCVGTRNHHLFARYIAVQAAVVLLGFHYALTACGRPSPYGYTWAYAILALMGLLVLPLGFLTVAHVLLVLTGHNSRQRLGAASGWVGGARGE
ncbi:hypothetical protein VOLCADRAFT_106181 [Volvox carteri f. nagariensis]|uniref:S-acyltransferase n=1 Tax=Volvox carteri f. nagariensis TaxID=3068 RepID=D8U5M6_VOLCA|nr:uncharacterized protein VOLCADRAFT_106181 [Volvox carteri f. nagariensis]EFJ44945.1 hypothetical protein VOLCADRAFT_106181 [Volvox carteri f. nagariensis]|eukprot:XP_002953916.1 hypothetical protein VOLCADRAFT_106181 [Volvox carteri f. nagariensis]